MEIRNPQRPFRFFPIYKTEEELQEERGKLAAEQSPIFNLNNNIVKYQTNKFKTALHPYEAPTTHVALTQLINKLQLIYEAGILQLPEQLDASKIKTIKIVENNIGRTVDFKQVYTLKKA